MCFQTVCRHINKEMDISIVRLKQLKVEMIEAFQNETLHNSIICTWHRAFTDGREFAEIEHVGGRLRTVVGMGKIDNFPYR